VSGPRGLIHERRAELVARADRERDELAAAFEPWRRPLATVDRGMSILAALKRTAPFLGAGIGVAATALAIIRPPRLAEWLDRGQAALSLARRLTGRR
jgi:hypothetical protein